MSSNSKTKPAFPGRTGMGYENGLSKLEYMSTQIFLHYLKVRDENKEGPPVPRLAEQAIYDAQQLMKSCEAAEKAGQ
jgi:hypothetical protein